MLCARREPWACLAPCRPQSRVEVRRYNAAERQHRSCACRAGALRREMLDPTRSAVPAASAVSAAQFDEFFQHSLDLLCVAGLDDGYFKRVNPSWTRVLGWTEEELLARPVHEIMHPADRERTLAARAELARGVPVRGLENRYLCKDGGFRWLSWQSITDSDRRLVFGIARDITEQRQLEQERLVVGKLESTGLLAGGMAHDYNNLLAALRLNLEMFELSDPLTVTQRQFVRQAKTTIDAAAALTRQLLTFADREVAGVSPLNLGVLVRQAAETTLAGSALRVTRRIAADLAGVRGNETQLTQVLRGLLLNAREAAPPEGTIEICAENTAAAATLPAGLKPGRYVRIAVRDDGPGIPSDVMPRIFDPYFSTKERGAQKGMGLGLTLCRIILNRHHGAITVDSAPGEGTTVVCYLPAIPPPSTAPNAS
jgi:PAS domain S-box-containing protein